MKKISKILVCLVIICVIIVTLIMILKDKQQGTDKIRIEDKFESNDTYQADNERIKELDNRNKYFAVKKIMEKYIYYIQEMKGIVNSQKYDDTDIMEDGINHLYDILDEEYISEFNVNKSNIQNKIKEYQNYDFEIKKIYMFEKSSNINIYFVYWKLDNDTLNFLIKTDSKNMTFSVFLGDYMENNKYDYNMNVKDIKISDKSIEKNDNNQFQYENISDELMATTYISDIKEKILTNPQVLYENYMEDNYKNERFGSLETFEKYINDNKNEFESIETTKYLVNKYDDYIEYVWLDQFNNYYIIKEKAIMNYTMEFDTYTILTEKFKETYDKSGDEYKCQMNVDKFFQMINRKDYKTSYKCLADSYKNNYFKTENDFANFVKSNFYKYNKITFKKSEQKGNRLYSFEIELTDITGKNTETKKVNVIMQLKDNYDFVMSFSM